MAVCDSVVRRRPFAPFARALPRRPAAVLLFSAPRERGREEEDAKEKKMPPGRGNFNLERMARGQREGGKAAQCTAGPLCFLPPAAHAPWQSRGPLLVRFGGDCGARVGRREAEGRPRREGCDARDAPCGQPGGS